MRKKSGKRSGGETPNRKWGDFEITELAAELRDEIVFRKDMDDILVDAIARNWTEIKRLKELLQREQ